MPFVNGSWKPNIKQERFLALPDTIREAFYGGGAGSGKSEVLLMYPIVKGWHNNGRFKQVFLRNTYPELKNEIVPRSKQIYPHFGGKFNKADMTWEFESGAVIFLGHCENEDDVHKYDSMEINLFTPDEITSLTEWKYLYIGFTRVRSSDVNLPAIVRGAGMPGGIGHTWVKKRLVDPAPQGNVIINGRGGNKRIFIPATLSDNPHIDKSYSTSLDALPEAERRAKKFGDWDSYSGQVFDEFRDQNYPDEPANALHVIPEFDIPSWWPKIVCIDWGYTAMTYVCYGAISPTRRVFIYREQFWYKTKIEEWAPYVREHVDNEQPQLIRICKSASQNRGQEHTILEQVSNALNRSVELTDNSHGSRVSGKTLLHEYLRWSNKHVPKRELGVYSEEHAQFLLRNNLNEYKKYLASFAPDNSEETNIPKLQIFESCKQLIIALKAATYDKPKDNKPAEDVAEFDGDDPYDCIRYMVAAADDYFELATSSFNKLQAREQIVKEFEQTQDWNKLYKQGRILDAQDVAKPIRRYHNHV